MRNLSAVIITFNEEQNIRRCIESVRSLCKEVLVLDSNSTDNTLAIAKECGARVLTQDFLGHREQKMAAIELAKYDLVISLDADEELSPELRDSIQTALLANDYDCYFMNRLNSFMGKWIHHGSWYPEKKMRLFDRRKYLMGGTNPHDRFDPAPGATTHWLSGNLLHHANEDMVTRMQTMNKYSSIAARASHKEGRKGSWLSIVVKPAFRFLSEYFLQQGFRDGFRGYYIAKTAGMYVWLRETKLMALSKNLEQ